MAAKPVCLVCQKEMVRGFLTDAAYGGIALPRWCEGEPKPGWWEYEVRSSQYKTGAKVVAYRCPQCEALRLYASSTTE